MMDDLKPYPAYKDPGVAWLGNIPEHWDVVPNRALFMEVKDRDHPDEEMLSVTITRGVVQQKTLLADSSKKDSSNQDRSAYKLVQPNDIAYNKMRAWQGAIGASAFRGIISPAYVVMRPREASNALFFHQLFRTPRFAKEAERWSYGITSDMWSLRPEHFKMIYSALPPHEEQAAIVRYLDYTNQKINRYIRAKKKQIELLNEQKQAIIHRAVTRGLDPNVKLKPSGVEWLGDVPEHWDVRPAKYLFKEIDYRTETGEEELLSVSHITGVTPRSQKNITMFMASSYVGHKVCQPGDLVINTMWAWMAALGVAHQTGIISPSYAVYRPLAGTSLLGDYADLLLRTKEYVSEYVCRSTGIRSSRLRLYPEQFLKISILYPPIEEQKRIVEQVMSDVKQIETACATTQQEIQLLNEYRMRLISDVVTGKLDIRAAAAQLPEITPEAEPLDEIEDVLHDDSTVEDEQDEAEAA